MCCKIYFNSIQFKNSSLDFISAFEFEFADDFHSKITITLFSGRLIRNQGQSVFCLVYSRCTSMKFYEDFTTATQNIPYLYFDLIVSWDFSLSQRTEVNSKK